MVDSGSTDGTVAIARAAGAEVIEIAAADFTFGYALNVGCEASTREIVVALSAHAFPPDDRWLERMVAWFDDPEVACACGDEAGPDGTPLAAPLVQDRALAQRFPHWGFTNAAGGFRRELWERHPFRADMPGTEDKEWAWHWLKAGHTCVVDPALLVDHGFHDDDGVALIFRRARREWAGFAMYLDTGPWPLREALAVWWFDQERYRAPFRARLDPERIARLTGRYLGSRDL